jgi:DNA-3-methyladenine glycosylase II
MFSRAIRRALFNHSDMPVTRSASGRSKTTVSKPASVAIKRKDEQSSASRAKKLRNVAVDSSAAINQTGAIESSTNFEGAVEASSNVLSAKLSFSFEEARRHLVGVDNRFQDLFSKMTCKPFEHLEQVHPFRLSLASFASCLHNPNALTYQSSCNIYFVRFLDLFGLPPKT